MMQGRVPIAFIESVLHSWVTELHHLRERIKNDCRFDVVKPETEYCVAGFRGFDSACTHSAGEKKSFSGIVIQYPISKILLRRRDVQSIVALFGGSCYTQDIIKHIPYGQRSVK